MICGFSTGSTRGYCCPFRLLIEYSGGNEFQEAPYLGVEVPGQGMGVSEDEQVKDRAGEGKLGLVGGVKQGSVR